MDGWTWEDMTVRADAGLVVAWPGAPRSRGDFRDEEEDASKGVAEAIRRIARAFDEAAAYHAARAADPAGVPEDVRWESMGAVLRGERPVFFEAEDAEQIAGAVTFAVARKLKPVIVGGEDASLCQDLLRKHEVPVIVGSIHRCPKREDADFDAMYALPAKLEDAGLLWCLASGEHHANVRNLPYAAGRAVAYGLDRDAALRAITLNAARIFGVDDRYGSIARGRSATLFLADGDALEVTTHVERAWVDGREIDLSNKQTALFEKYREKYRQLGLIK
jgi:imidazolonepropionase-like amidohydrolase